MVLNNYITIKSKHSKVSKISIIEIDEEKEKLINVLIATYDTLEERIRKSDQKIKKLESERISILS